MPSPLPAVLGRHFARVPDRGTLRGMTDSYNGFAFTAPPRRVAADAGLEVLARARKLGIQDDDAGIDDGG